MKSVLSVGSNVRTGLGHNTEIISSNGNTSHFGYNYYRRGARVINRYGCATKLWQEWCSVLRDRVCESWSWSWVCRDSQNILFLLGLAKCVLDYLRSTWKRYGWRRILSEKYSNFVDYTSPSIVCSLTLSAEKFNSIWVIDYVYIYFWVLPSICCQFSPI